MNGFKVLTYGKPLEDKGDIIGAISVAGEDSKYNKGDQIRLVLSVEELRGDLSEFGAIATPIIFGSKEVLANPHISKIPVIHSLKDYDFISHGDIIYLSSRNGFIRSLFRPQSHSNTIFITEQCDSNCLMCSQPPKDIDDFGRAKEHLRLVDLIPDSTEVLGITGGEPTLFGNALLDIIKKCKEKLPHTALHMLTNGRSFKSEEFTKKLWEVGHPNLTLGIPLYSDLPEEHDYVVQAKGAFDETLIGLHNLARFGIQIEIRVVIHKQTYSRLINLAEFIWRNLPFVNHIALMGLEMMGYVKKNLELLWIDPVEYQDELEEAVRYLHYRKMHISIYNHQLCLLRENLWSFARKSISDFKNIYLDECMECGAREMCGGLFKSAEFRHSKHIKPLAIDAPQAQTMT